MISTSDIAAIGITNQRETTLIRDKKTGIPVYKLLFGKAFLFGKLFTNTVYKQGKYVFTNSVYKHTFSC